MCAAWGTTASTMDRTSAIWTATTLACSSFFGSFEPEGEKVIYGLTKNINSNNPLRIAFHEWIDIWNDVRNADTWRLKLRYVFGRPGWKEDRLDIGEGNAVPASPRLN
jgi:hypothetical protein